MDHEEFFRWITPIDIVDNDDEEKEIHKEIFSEISCLLKECPVIERKELEQYVQELTIMRRESLIKLFRILTGTAKTNFEIFFAWYLIKKDKNIKLSIIESNRDNPFTNRLTIKKKEYTNTIKNFAILLDDPHCRTHFFNYFDEKNLLKKIKAIKEEPTMGEKILEQLIKFDQRGAKASKRGSAAEEITRKKFEEFGLERNIDFNLTDFFSKELIIKQLEKSVNSTNKIQIQNKINKIKNTDLDRQADLLLFLDDPAIIIQSSYYNSDTASIAAGTRDQNQAELEIITTANEVMDTNKILYVGLIDGVGFHSIDRKRYESLIESVEEYFGLRTTSTKLRKSLHNVERTVPIDFEVALFLNNEETTEEELIKTVKKLYGIPDEKIIKDLKKWKNRNKFENNLDKIKLKTERVDLAKKFCVLDIAYLLAEKDKEGKIIVPGSDIPVNIDEIKRIILEFNAQVEIDVEEVIKKLEQDMEIILIQE